MPASAYKTHTITNNGQGKVPNPNPPPPRIPAPIVNDLTIEFDRPVKVLGVNGISPSDPNAPYTLDGDESAKLTITDLAQVGPNGSVKVRVKSDSPPAKIKADRTFWTLDEVKVLGGILFGPGSTAE